MLRKQNFLITIFLLILIVVLPACDSGSDNNTTLEKIEVTPTNSSIANGTTQQFTAVGLYSDGSKQDLTTQVHWLTSNETIAIVGLEGIVTSVGEGEATITASLSEVSGNTRITVTAAILTSIRITPTNSSIANGTTQQFMATGLYSDGSKQDLTTQVDWRTSNENIAMVNNNDNDNGSNGIVTSAGEGKATITASFSEISGNTPIRVTTAVLTSIEVTPADSSIAKGTTQQFTAMGFYSDGSEQDLTTQVDWTSDKTFAMVSNDNGSNGIVTSANEGEATITASFSGVSGNTLIELAAAVLTSIEVTPADSSIIEGTTQQFTAMGFYSDGSDQYITTQVTWRTSDETVAVVSNTIGTEGVVTGIIKGDSTITASLSAIESIPVNIVVTVDPDAPLSLSIVAQPNVILNDGNDSSTLFVTVQPNSPSGQIADDTLVDFEADTNVVNLDNSTVGTISGQLSNQLTSGTDSVVTIKASVQGTSISDSVGVTVVSDFSSIFTTKFTTNHLQSDVSQPGYYEAGTTFSLAITNASNRIFELNKFEATNGLFVTTFTDEKLLSDHDIDGGETVGITVTLNNTQLDVGYGYVLTYFLSDPATGQEFSISHSF